MPLMLRRWPASNHSSIRSLPVYHIMGVMEGYLPDDLDELTRGLPSLPDQFREWTDRLMRTKDSVGSLLAYPGELAREVTGYRGGCQKCGD